MNIGLNNKVYEENVNTSPDPIDNFANVQINVVGKWGKKKTSGIRVQTHNDYPEDNDDNDNNEADRNLKSFNVYLTDDDDVDNVNDYSADIPEFIEAIFKYDFNIMEIHNLIMKKFKYRQNKEINILKEELEAEYEIMRQGQTLVDRKASIRKVEKLKSEIENIETGAEFEEYLGNIKPLLEEYNLLGTISKIINFATKKTDYDDVAPESPNSQQKRHSIIFDFAEIANKYLKVDLIKDSNNDQDICTTCKQPLDIDTEDESGLIICPHCNSETVIIARNRFYHDNTRTNNSVNNYEDKSNFIKVIKRYQGKEADKPSQDLYKRLKKYFIDKKLPRLHPQDTNDLSFLTPQQVRDLPLNESGEKEYTSRSLMYKALKETGNSKYYDHINIILHEMWGWKLPDISHIEKQLIADYDASQEIYESLPKDRKSSLNTQFRLYKHLRKLGHPCKAKDFRIPTTPDILEFHENTWSIFEKMLGW